jgi:hypothetical protein
MSKTPKPPDTSFLRALGLVGQVGLVMVLAIGFGVTFGLYLDRVLSAGGMILIPMIFAGVALGAFFAYRLLAKEIP